MLITERDEQQYKLLGYSEEQIKEIKEAEFKLANAGLLKLGMTVEQIKERDAERIAIQEASYAPSLSADGHEAKASEHDRAADKLKSGPDKDAHVTAATAHRKAASLIRDADTCSALADAHN